MDAGIADTINRQTARVFARYLDSIDHELGFHSSNPWHRSPIADTLMDDNDATNADRAWLVGAIATKARPGRIFSLPSDNYPADGDWENLFSNIRAEILTRRDPQTSPARAAEIPARDGVGSR